LSGLGISFGGVKLKIITAGSFIHIFWFVMFIPTHLANSAIIYGAARNLEWPSLCIKPFFWLQMAL